MAKNQHRVPAGVEPDEAARHFRAIDKLEERMMVAPAGLHRVGPAATAEACAAAGLPPASALLWMSFDGMEIGAETARILPLAEIAEATERADAEGLLRAGDRVIGEHGRDLLIVPEDPWEEGADVVRLEEGGERLPEATTVAHLALGWVGEAGVMFDDDGEFRDELFGEDGELTAAAQRRLLRRRLDCDPDAPGPRLRLAQHLLRAGELRAAAKELKEVVHRAPDLPWAHETMARVAEARDDADGARRAYQRAAETVEAQGDIAASAYFLACAARSADEDQRKALAERVQSARPGFAREQVEAAEILIERGALTEAGVVVDLGLSIAPVHVELLALRSRLSADA
ncbi:MAG: hypothetical protein AAF799_32290 [Myxococcota bacterium]